MNNVLVKLIIRKTSVRCKTAAKAGSGLAITGKDPNNQAKFSLSAPQRRDSYTYPAELIAAAYANSFSLALSMELKPAAFAHGEVVISATITLHRVASRWTILNIHLHIAARLPKMTERQFIAATVKAKANCLFSGLLSAKLSLSVKLEK